MLNLQTLAGLLRDEELRQKLTRVTSAKIKADIKALQANAELSRRLIEGSLRTGARGDTANGEQMLRAVVNEHLDYYGTLTELSAAFSDRLLAMLSAIRKEAAGARAPALGMNLKGPLGGTLRAPFEIENNRPEPITAVFRLTPYVSEDGNQLVAANHAFDPPQAVVPAGGKLRVVFVQPLGEGFTADRDYLATISVEGMEAMQIIVRLHVTKAAEGAEPAAETPPAEAAPAGGPSRPEESPKKRGSAHKDRPAKRKKRGRGSSRQG